ncbi:two-component sensor histidine kinase [Bombiscardovia nodaiensis]|uniref:Sensor-like histidine kinase SenX3 n=1 Tax=Bombiscardovia nodaiensis TaxID=2932181 RepID=A0ABM8B772_9BIFI|nr:two-component sensor histidine kinase [Bombiscardovia nodaiensis]
MFEAVLLIIVLIIAVCLLAGWLAMLIADLRRMTRDLDYINRKDTNASVTASTSLCDSRRLAAAINANLDQTRRLQQQQFSQELRLRQMLTNLTHDIKTPLTVARGYVQLMGEGAQGELTTASAKAASSLDSVDYYLRYLMDFTLMQEKGQALALSRVNLSKLLQDDLFTVFDQLSAKGVAVEPSIEPGIVLTSDETLLHRIVQNLIGNWLKYASTSAQAVLQRLQDGRIELTLSNQTKQPFVSAQELAERFSTSQPQISLSEGMESSGLGLNIVRGLVKALGGSMELATNPGQFAVSLYLPEQKSMQKPLPRS